MSPKLSEPDPNWWPAPPPPNPPPPISKSAIAVGGIVAVFAAGAIAFAVLGPKSHHDPAPPSVPVRSLSTFASCLEQQGVLTPSAETNDAMLRPAAAACRSYVPLVDYSPHIAAEVQKLVEQCFQDAQSKLRGSSGALGGFGAIAGAANAHSVRAAFQKASAVCRAESFDEPGGSGGTTTGPTPVA